MKHQLCKVGMLIFILSLAIVVCMTPAFAHEYNPPRYPNDISYNSSMNKVVATITYSMADVKTSKYRTQLSNAINDWEWLDDGFVSLKNFSNGSVQFFDTWPSTFASELYGRTDASINFNSTLYSYGDGMIGPAQLLRGYAKINSCEVRINRAKCERSGLNDREIQKTWAHEIGHTLGLNETIDGTISIMKQGRGNEMGWSEYWKPQNHDRSDLKRFNFKSWT